jgi:AcrR family transcriptional regulator
LSTTELRGSTKDRILDAAEGLFAQQGFSATSLRAITAEAGVNLAAVNYHFGSKDGLLEAVFGRRLGPLNDERLALLDEAESTPGGASLEGVLEALVGPPLRLHRDHERGGPQFMRLMGRTLTEPTDNIQEIFLRQFREIAERFTSAMRRALPGLPADEIFWRAHFAIGAMAHTMCDTFRLRLISGGLCEAGDDAEAIIRRLVVFLAAGMRAPVASGVKGAGS